VAFNSSRFHRINHLIDAFFEAHDPVASLAEMMQPDYWPAAPQHGPNARPPLVEPGQFGVIRPADGHDYLIRVYDLTPDGRAILGFIRSGPPPTRQAEPPVEPPARPTPTASRKAA